MAKRWTLQEDEFIHTYFDAVGDFIGPHDLGRPKGAVTRRAAHLRSTGAWDALSRMEQARHDYLTALGVVFVTFHLADERLALQSEEPAR